MGRKRIEKRGRKGMKRTSDRVGKEGGEGLGYMKGIIWGESVVK